MSGAEQGKGCKELRASAGTSVSKGRLNKVYPSARQEWRAGVDRKGEG